MGDALRPSNLFLAAIGDRRPYGAHRFHLLAVTLTA